MRTLPYMIRTIKEDAGDFLVAGKNSNYKTEFKVNHIYFTSNIKGAIPPHLPESNEQNQVVMEAFLEAAKRYVRGGYDVIVDGIIGRGF